MWWQYEKIGYISRENDSNVGWGSDSVTQPTSVEIMIIYILGQAPSRLPESALK